MSKLSKAQIIFLSIFALIFTYFLAGFLDIAVNKALKKLPQIWSVGFTAQAIVCGYPKIYQCLFLSALFSFGIVFIGAFLPKKRSLFGDARFATASEVEKMNLYTANKENNIPINFISQDISQNVNTNFKHLLKLF